MNIFEGQVEKATTADAKIKNTGIRTGQEVFEFYRDKNNRLKMEDFSDIYKEEEIMRDRNELEKMKDSENFEKSDVHGKVLENLFPEIGKKNFWMGEEEFYIIQLSEYDDKMKYGAHADVLIEMRNSEGKIIRFAVDLTTGANMDKLNAKKTKCVKGIEIGTLSSVKYFQSEIEKFRGRIIEVPVVVAGIDKETLHALCDAIGRGENIQNHPAKFMILEEIWHDFSVLLAIANNLKGKKHPLTKKISDCFDVVAALWENKKSLLPHDFAEKASQDKVYKHITRFF